MLLWAQCSPHYGLVKMQHNSLKCTAILHTKTWNKIYVIHIQRNPLEQKTSSGRRNTFPISHSVIQSQDWPLQLHITAFIPVMSRYPLVHTCTISNLFYYGLTVCLTWLINPSWSYVSYMLWRNILHVWFISYQAMVIFAYAVAVLFFDVYDMAIDTIFLCFCEYTVNMWDDLGSFHSVDSYNGGKMKHSSLKTVDSNPTFSILVEWFLIELRI